MQRQELQAGTCPDALTDLLIEIGCLPVGEAPRARGVAHRSVAMFGAPTLRVRDAASAAARRRRWPEQEWLRLTVLTIRREAPRATPYVTSSASLNSRTSKHVRLALYSCLQTRK